jgi:hypothetical protein
MKITLPAASAGGRVVEYMAFAVDRIRDGKVRHSRDLPRIPVFLDVT